MLFQSHHHCPVCQNKGAFWCEAKDWEYRVSGKTYTYLRCPFCKTIFIEDVPHDSLSEIYPSHYYSFSAKTGGLLFKLKDRIEQKFYTGLLKELNDPSLAVLDIGGGSGTLLTGLKTTDKRIGYTEIVDINKEAMKLALLQGHHFTLSTIEDYTTEKKFNIILLLNLIEHIPNPKKTLQRIEELLLPGGIVIIKTPNADSLDARLFKTTYWGGLHCPRHWIIFTDQSFQMMLTGIHLPVKKLSFTQGAPFWAYSIINLFRRKNILLKKKPLMEHPFFPLLGAVFALFDFCRSRFSKTSQMFIILKK